MSSLTDHDLLRYSRHILLPQIDLEGQEKLLNAHILVIGCGGLGSTVLPILAGSGIGTITFIDFDKIELSNLQRQTSYSTLDIDTYKTEAMYQKLYALNPHIQLNAINQRIELDGLKTLCSQVTCIIDCTDNFKTRTEINKAALHAKVPLVSGSIVRFEGQIAVYDFRDNTSPCYACLFSGDSASDGDCALFGVFAPLVHIIGAMEAQEALKIILDIQPLLTHQLRTYNALTGEWQIFKFNQNPHCIENH